MKHLMIVILVLCSINAAAVERKGSIEEYNEINEKALECAELLIEAQRHDNVWQSNTISISECKDRAMELMFIGQRMMRDSLDHKEK